MPFRAEQSSLVDSTSQQFWLTPGFHLSVSKVDGKDKYDYPVINKGEVLIYARWGFPPYPLILPQNLKLKGTCKEFGNADSSNQSQHNYLRFSRPVTEEKSVEQLVQTCSLWLITGDSQSDQWFCLNV